jgi:two-component system LytT family response regulator
MLTRPIRALIVEDEPGARERIRDWLGRLPGVEVIGECPRGPEAVDALRELAPDLLLEGGEGPATGTGLVERLQEALARARAAQKRPTARLFVRQGTGRVRVVKPEEVDWVEAAGNYVRLHVGREVYLLRGRITALEAQLDPDRFVRIHRSTLVNIDRIQELQPWFHGDYVAVLQDGTQLSVSRSYRDRVLGLGERAGREAVEAV